MWVSMICVFVYEELHKYVKPVIFLGTVTQLYLEGTMLFHDYFLIVQFLCCARECYACILDDSFSQYLEGPQIKKP
jgi:hypothetical protein